MQLTHNSLIIIPHTGQKWLSKRSVRAPTASSVSYSFKGGLELMRELGEPMEFGIFDFCKVFSRAFVKGVMGQLGFEWKPGDIVNEPKCTSLYPGHQDDDRGFFYFNVA